jgi:hypothetical protein
VSPSVGSHKGTKRMSHKKAQKAHKEFFKSILCFLCLFVAKEF